ncbi:MAG: DUF3187 family protein [Nitrospirae bacterium]|nr:DUF3187 family protein [Nitrospirota bacterium]
MKTAPRAILFFFLFLACPFTAAFSFEGPFQARNLYPIFLHANQPYLEKAEMENSASLSLSHSSTYTVDSSADWDVNLDMEITSLNFTYRRILRDFIEFDLDVPVLVIGEGFMDGFLESYHSTFGFADYGRSRRPNNEFLYEIKKDGVLLVKGHSDTKLGDVRLALKKSLISLNGLALSVKGDVEVPVGNAKEGYGNGSLDAGAAVLLDMRITDRLMSYWSFGAVFPGDVKGHETIDLRNFIYGGGAIEADAGKGFGLLVQVMGQSSFFPETGVEAVDGEAVMITFGGRYHKGGNSFDLSLTEDLNVSGSPDFIANLTYKMEL